jgi:hypothetical protein
VPSAPPAVNWRSEAVEAVRWASQCDLDTVISFFHFAQIFHCMYFKPMLNVAQDQVPAV